MNKLYTAVNLLRSFLVWLIVKYYGLQSIIEKDMLGYRYAVGKSKNRNGIILFNQIMCKRKLFRNIVVFRIKQKSKLAAITCKFIFPIKTDFELCQGNIGGGLTVYHGHGTVIVCEKAGINLRVYQGVTIGKNPKGENDRIIPVIGDNVTIYTNAVVAGGITIGNNVDIGAGAVVMKNVPDNTIVIGNPCKFKRK